MTKHQSVLGNVLEVDDQVNDLAKSEGAVALVRLMPSGSRTRSLSANLTRQSALELAAEVAAGQQAEIGRMLDIRRRL